MAALPSGLFLFAVCRRLIAGELLGVELFHEARHPLLLRRHQELGRSVSVDLEAAVAGYRARRHAGVIDLDREDGHDPHDFWEPLEPRRGELLLDPGEFYILASKEPIEIPVLEAAEMTPIDPAVGEFRVHYAGFFDPGFGTAETDSVGSKGVLEVRSHEPPFLLEDGQTVARLVFQPLTERPARLYGENGSHYQRQGLKLSKHFRAW